ncbi:MAG: hypothetical protein A4E36_00057 [Methanoregulaceae archaeon PtaB.Bin009]|nr:MAG: hypothetical protein A4E36_00057 [Methanoregulaceae archaeon PtaB.Bin009]
MPPFPGFISLARNATSSADFLAPVKQRVCIPWSMHREKMSAVSQWTERSAGHEWYGL